MWDKKLIQKYSFSYCRSLWEWEPVWAELFQPARLHVRVWLQWRILPLIKRIHLLRLADPWSWLVIFNEGPLQTDIPLLRSTSKKMQLMWLEMTISSISKATFFWPVSGKKLFASEMITTLTFLGSWSKTNLGHILILVQWQLGLFDVQINHKW